MKKNAICKNCSKPFIYDNTNRAGVFCSRECYRESIKISTKICLVCGKEYTPDRGTKDRWDESKYCSIDCLNKSKFKGSFVKCSNCGKELWRTPKDLKKRKHFWCSLECEREVKKIITTGENNGMFGKTHSKEVKEAQSKRMALRLRKGIHNKRSICCKRANMNNQFFRSSWEANYARYLDYNNIKWEYEPKTFTFPLDRGTTRYTPDFYLPETNVWVEVKGYMDKKSQIKVVRFRKYYPQEKLVLICGGEYRDLDRKYRHIIPNWEQRNARRQNSVSQVSE